MKAGNVAVKNVKVFEMVAGNTAGRIGKKSIEIKDRTEVNGCGCTPFLHKCSVYKQ